MQRVEELSNFKINFLERSLALGIEGIACLAPPMYSNELTNTAFARIEKRLRYAVEQNIASERVVINETRMLLAMARQKRLSEFFQCYDATIGAEPLVVDDDVENVAMFDDDDMDNSDDTTTCSNCADESVSTRNMLRMRCCGAEVCVSCLAQHAFHNVSGSTTKCIYCRHTYNVFRPSPSAPEAAN